MKREPANLAAASIVMRRFFVHVRVFHVKHLYGFATGRASAEMLA